MQDLLIKTATVIAVAFATFSSFPGTAQQDPTAQQQCPQVQQNAPTPQNSALPNGNGAASGELLDKLDAKSAKQGDRMIVKTDQNTKMSVPTEVSKGSKQVRHR